MRRGLTIGLAVAYAAAGGIHLAVGAQHLGLDRRHAAFFLLVGAWQLGWGGPDPPSSVPNHAPPRSGGTLGLVAVWIVSRTAGLPAFLGSTGPEPVGSLDLMALGLEMGIVAGSTALARRAGLPRALRSPWVVASCRGVGIVLVAVLVGGLVLWGPGERAHDHEHAPPDLPVRITVHREPDGATNREEPSPSESPTPESAETHTHRDDRAHAHAP